MLSMHLPAVGAVLLLTAGFFMRNFQAYEVAVMCIVVALYQFAGPLYKRFVLCLALLGCGWWLANSPMLPSVPAAGSALKIQVHKTGQSWGVNWAKGLDRNGCFRVRNVPATVLAGDEISGNIDRVGNLGKDACYSVSLSNIRVHVSQRSWVRRWNLENIRTEISGLLNAVLWGDKSSLDPNIIQGFNQAGISHLLAVSGLHIGYVTLMLWLLAGGIVLAFPREQRFVLRRLLLVGLLPIFVYFTAGSASIYRAFFITILIAFAMGVRIARPSYISLLAIYVIANMAHSTTSILGLGLQLTVCITAVLVIHTGSMRYIKSRWFATIAKLQFLILPTALATLILDLHGISSSQSAVIANIIAIPVFSLVSFPSAWFLQFTSVIGFAHGFMADYVAHSFYLLAQLQKLPSVDLPLIAIAVYMLFWGVGNFWLRLRNCAPISVV